MTKLTLPMLIKLPIKPLLLALCCVVSLPRALSAEPISAAAGTTATELLDKLTCQLLLEQTDPRGWFEISSQYRLSFTTDTNNQSVLQFGHASQHPDLCGTVVLTPPFDQAMAEAMIGQLRPAASQIIEGAAAEQIEVGYFQQAAKLFTGNTAPASANHRLPSNLTGLMAEKSAIVRQYAQLAMQADQQNNRRGDSSSATAGGGSASAITASSSGGGATGSSTTTTGTSAQAAGGGTGGSIAADIAGGGGGGGGSSGGASASGYADVAPLVPGGPGSGGGGGGGTIPPVSGGGGDWTEPGANDPIESPTNPLDPANEPPPEYRYSTAGETSVPNLADLDPARWQDSFQQELGLGIGPNPAYTWRETVNSADDPSQYCTRWELVRFPLLKPPFFRWTYECVESLGDYCVGDDELCQAVDTAWQAKVLDTVSLDDYSDLAAWCAANPYYAQHHQACLSLNNSSGASSNSSQRNNSFRFGLPISQ